VTFRNALAHSTKCSCVYLAFSVAPMQVIVSCCQLLLPTVHRFAALGITANEKAGAASSFILGGVCASIISASPVFCSFCSLAPSLISHIDVMRAMPDVVPHLEEGGHYPTIHAAFTRVLVFIGKVRVRFVALLSVRCTPYPIPPSCARR
jgi:hypothetical protein